MRKLAKIVTILTIEPIENADMIELIHIEGWQVVCKKGQFVEGDRAVYFEYDSMLPLDDSRFSFLAGRNEYTIDDIKYARIKTMKLRKTLSQGLLLPWQEFFNEISDCAADDSLDLAEQIGVIKYEPKMPVQLSGLARGNFPPFIQKTDQERVNNISRQYYDAVESGEKFELTVKLDGSSITCHCYAAENRTGVCSRNLELKTDESNADNTFVKMYTKHFQKPLESFMASTGRSIAIQGEMVGPGIQNNFEGLDKVAVYVYDVFDIDEQRYLLPHERYLLLQTLENEHGGCFEYVPLLAVKTTLPESVEQCIEQADGPSGLNGKYREGVVYKSRTRNFTFKAISVKYLLKEK